MCIYTYIYYYLIAKIEGGICITVTMVIIYTHICSKMLKLTSMFYLCGRKKKVVFYSFIHMCIHCLGHFSQKKFLKEEK
jgi:hypothetical protein